MLGLLMDASPSFFASCPEPVPQIQLLVKAKASCRVLGGQEQVLQEGTGRGLAPPGWKCVPCALVPRHEQR